MTEMEPAILPAILLADSVLREEGTRKLTIIGIFSVLNAFKLPLMVPPFCVVVILTNLRGKLDQVPITVRIEVKGSGQVVACQTAMLSTDQEIRQNELLELPFAIRGGLFQVAGMHDIVVLVKNEEIGRRAFEVKTVTAGTTPQIPGPKESEK